MANLAKCRCTACGTLFRLAASIVQRASGAIWCPVCLSTADADGVDVLTPERREEIRRSVEAYVEAHVGGPGDPLRAVNRVALDQRAALKRRAEISARALKRCSQTVRAMKREMEA